MKTELILPPLPAISYNHNTLPQSSCYCVDLFVLINGSLRILRKYLNDLKPEIKFDSVLLVFKLCFPGIVLMFRCTRCTKGALYSLHQIYLRCCGC